jgi:bla regulator protein BlaR1
VTRAKASIVFLSLTSVAIYAQTAPSSEYEASVKPSSPSAPSTGINLAPGGRLTANGATLRMLITFTEDLMDYQVTGGPSWINSDRFDIVARLDNPIGADPRAMSEDQRKQFQQQVRKMVQNILADRFQFKSHRETKDMPLYELVADKNGPKLTASQPDARPRIRRTAMGQMTGQAVNMKLLAEFLSAQVGRSVTDKTGLTGEYDVKLEWSPSPDQVPPSTASGAGQPPQLPEGASIFTALKEQLGLKLESLKGPVSIMVIDHVEKPSAN